MLRMETLEHNKVNMRLLLQSEFLKKTGVESNYSLRSFSKFLGVHHGTLSQMLKGKRDINDRYKEQFIKAISPEPETLLKFKEKESGEKSFYEKKYEEITMDVFEYISEWYYDAILNLIKIKNFKPDSKAISHLLGIPACEVNIAVERLKRLGLLTINKDGKWSRKFEDTTTTQYKYSTAAKRKLQHQLLKKAEVALENIPFEKRSQSSMMMAINRNKLTQAKELIKKFRREMNELLEVDEACPDSVYQLLVSFFPLAEVELTKEVEDEENS